MTIHIESPAFEAGSPIPREHTGEGENTSPPLRWENVPAAARELALICDDPDAPRDEPWVHWVLYHLDPGTRELAAGQDAGGTEGTTDFGSTGYGGPMPPPGHGPHHYHFKIFALEEKLDLEPGATKKELLQAMEGRVLDNGELVGTYER